MARPLRIQYQNAYYHTTCRGNAREIIFLDDQDRKTFLTLLESSSLTYGVEVFCYVLMNNHFHLVLKTPRGNLSEFMRHFNISYTSFFNRRQARVGHLYQGRYKAFLIEADRYLLEVSRYVHLNPIRTQEKEKIKPKERLSLLKSYPWSTFSGYFRNDKRESFINYREVLSYLGGDTPSSRRKYITFVLEGLKREIANPIDTSRGHSILGSDSFVEGLKDRFLAQDAISREQPELRRLKSLSLSPEEVIESILHLTGRSSREVVAKSARGSERAIALELLYRYCELSQDEIGEIMGGVNYTAVSLARKRLKNRMAKDKELVRRFDEIEDTLLKTKAKSKM